jgi:hypothetical protein
MFWRMAQPMSGSDDRSHVSIAGLPAAGSAATTTLHAYASACRKTFSASPRGLGERARERVTLEQAESHLRRLAVQRRLGDGSHRRPLPRRHPKADEAHEARPVASPMSLHRVATA